MLTFEEITQGSSRLYGFYLLRHGRDFLYSFNFNQENPPFQPSECWTFLELVGVESQFSSLIKEINDHEVFFVPIDQEGYFPEDYRYPCYEAHFNFVHFYVVDQGYESVVKDQIIGCLVKVALSCF